MLTARIAVFVSGGGTNLQALLDAEAAGVLHSGKIVLVVSDKPGAYALERAEKAGVETALVDRKACAGQAEFESRLLALLKEREIDMIVLAGFMRILTGDFTRRFPRRILNVHPALIPSFCGKGYYGLKVHEKALERGVKVTGATVHFVDEGTDTGPIILQKAVEIQQGDTPKILQQRVMEQAEWVIMPKAIDLIANGRIRVENGKVVFM